MRSVFGIYGYDLTRPLTVAGITVRPCIADVAKTRQLAIDQKAFHLTAMGESPDPPDAELLFDLSAVLTFSQQQWIEITSIRAVHDATGPQDTSSLFAPRLDIPYRRPKGGSLISRDLNPPETEREFLELCLKRLQDQTFNKATNFRKAFFRNVEAWRLRVQAAEFTYYLNFSALEILARTDSRDYKEKNVAKILTPFLTKHGFNVKQNCPKSRERSMQTYAHLRNALFHNGEWKTTFNENDIDVTLNIADYAVLLERLVADVLLRLLGYNDPSINWDRWIDRQPFNAIKQP